MCLCVHVDTVLLCLKHHFQFQQQEWKAMSSSDTFVVFFFFFLTLQIQNTTPKRELNIILHCLLLLTSHFLCCPLSSLASKKEKRSKEAEIKKVRKKNHSFGIQNQVKKKKTTTIRYSF